MSQQKNQIEEKCQKCGVKDDDDHSIIRETDGSFTCTECRINRITCDCCGEIKHNLIHGWDGYNLCQVCARCESCMICGKFGKKLCHWCRTE